MALPGKGKVERQLHKGLGLSPDRKGSSESDIRTVSVKDLIKIIGKTVRVWNDTYML